VNLRSIAAAILGEPIDSQKGVPESEDVSNYERFAYPYRFHPTLSFSDAAVLALRALLRIFLVSTLFGTWGAGATVLWNHTGNSFLRAAGLTLLTASLALAAVWMLVITARVGQKRARNSAS